MKFALSLTGAVIVVAIAGAVSGAAIGGSNMLARAHSETLPEGRIVTVSNDAMLNSERPPDHYPLKTPKGTIEVAELALHGRLRERGGTMWWENRSDETVRVEAGYDFHRTANPERIAREEALLAFTGGRADYQEHAADTRADDRRLRRITRAEAPMELADPVGVTGSPVEPQTAKTGKAKSIEIALGRN